MMEKRPSVGVVVVNWNTRDYLVRALASFVVDGVSQRQIVVVDQGSTDGSVALVRKRFSGVKIVSRPSNDGYSSAVNAGAAQLKTDFLVVANADIWFAEGTLKSLSEVLEREDSIAVVGPALTDTKGARTTRFSRTGALRSVALVLLPTFVRGWWKATEGWMQATVEPKPVRFVEGCFMIIRRKLFDEIGGFDEAFTFYFEDADFCLRLRKLGYKLVHSPYATVTHIGGASFGREPDKSSIEFYRGCLLFYRLHLYRRYVWLKRGLRVTVFFRELLEHIRFGEAGRWRTLRTLINSESETHTFSPRSSRPFVSVILPTFERVDCLIDALKGLLRQSYRNFEIIVVDQSKTKDARKERFYRQAGKRLVVVRPARANRSFAKNLGAQRAKGEILLFCDDDIEVPEDLIQTHVAAYGDRRIGGVSCRVVEGHSYDIKTSHILRVTPYGRMIAGFQSDVTSAVKTLVGANMSTFRSVWQDVGGFDTTFVGTSVFEEPDFSARVRRAGWRLVFTNATTVRHDPQPEGNDDLKCRTPSDYYRSFHHNELIYFLKNHSRLNLLLVIPFCLLRTVNQTVKFRMGFRQSLRVFGGVFEGFRKYYQIYG